MLAQLLNAMTPELIIHSLKENPKIFISTLHKFETFKLVAAALSNDQQVLVSKNLEDMNGFLRSNNGRDSIKLLVEEFATFVKDNAPVNDSLRASIEAEIRAEIEAKIRSEIMAETMNKVKAA